MFETWVDPFPDRDTTAEKNITNVYEEVYGELKVKEKKRDG